MSVKHQHPDYVAMSGKWKRCRDVAAGQDAVHAAKAAYLPKLKDQTDDDYSAYVQRALFFGATWRTIAGLVGMLFRKPPAIEAPAGVTEFLADITTGGVPFHVFAQQVSEESLTVGRVGVLVDYPQAPEVRTRAEELALNLRPSMQLYQAESIINWRTSTVNNQHIVAMVVLTESHSEPKDEFEDVTETRYRVLDLVEGVYRQRLFRVKKDNTGKEVDEQIGADMFPAMGGKKLSSIPFWFIGTDDITTKVDEPPLIDLVDVNLSHYRTTADYEHGCHFTGLPTAVVSGYNPQANAEGVVTEKLYIGSTAAWVFPDPTATAVYLEFTGQGLGALEKNLDRKEAQMAVLGARMLSAEKKQAEAAETAAIHRTGENSVLAGVAQTISLGLTMAIKTFCEWAGAAGDASIDLNRDFFPMPMTPQMMKELVAAWQSRAISFETLFSKLQQGEIQATDVKVDDEKERIEAEGPALGTLTDPKPAPANA